MATLFISDLHLDASRPQALQTFEDLLNSLDDAIDGLYILGDLFEFWNGDDDLTDVHQRIVKSLKNLTTRGVKCYFMCGNRDFLVGKNFSEMTGVTVLPDPTVIDLYKQSCLLMHGDLLCSDDHNYQRFRWITHLGWLQRLYLWLPLSFRRSIAKRIRTISVEENQQKPPEIMDVNQTTVENYMQQYQVTLLIHGHTHRQAIHDFSIANKAAKRIVLGDWYDGDSVLVCGRGNQQFMRIQDFIRTR